MPGAEQAAAAPPAAAMPAAPAPPAVAPLRVGVVGLGAWGSLHALTLRRLRTEGVVLIAICDSDQTALASASRLCPGVPTFTDIDAALAQSSAEAWVCATDTPSHVSVCKSLLAAGRSVLCEQPLADELAAAASLEMYVEAGAGGSGQGKLMVAHTGLFDPDFRAMRGAASNKGPLSLIACQEHLPASTLHPARRKHGASAPDPFGATFSDWAAKLRALVGSDKEPAVVRASAFKGHDAHYGTAAEDSAEHLAMAQLLWDDGLVATISCDRLLPDGAAPSASLSIAGRGWSVSSDGGGQAARGSMMGQLLADIVVPQAAQPLMLPPRDDGLGACGPLADQLRSFARFCRQGQTHIPVSGSTFEDGLAVVRWLDQMRKAAADSHRALPLSLLSVSTFVSGADAEPVSWRDSTAAGRRQYKHRVHAAPASRALPVTVLNAAETGPTLVLLAGLGGDEAEGMAALQHMLASVKIDSEVDDNPSGGGGGGDRMGVGTTLLRRGRIVAVNCCNIDGYDLGCGSRYAASDGLDLSRAFPGACCITFIHALGSSCLLCTTLLPSWQAGRLAGREGRQVGRQDMFCRVGVRCPQSVVRVWLRVSHRPDGGQSYSARRVHADNRLPGTRRLHCDRALRWRLRCIPDRPRGWVSLATCCGHC